MPEKILLVEDNDDTRDYMRIMLELSDYMVFEACDGREAVELALTKFPDLILMDISLPVMGGISATLAIRNSLKYKVPIIAVTAYGQFCERSALEAGFDELIAKPIDTKKLTAVLNKYLRPQEFSADKFINIECDL